VPGDGSAEGGSSLIDEIVRDGARRMLAAALEAEVDAYLAEFAGERDEAGRRLVIRNGRARPRQVTTAGGAVEVVAPRVNDKRVDPVTGERRRFSSAILPPWCRKTPKIAEVLPLLYLHGLSSGDFVPALEQFLGSSAGLSAATVTRLTAQWQQDFQVFACRDLSTVDYVYLWADGIHVNIRLEEAKLCLLVMVGVRADGRKELVAMADGYRESEGSWADLLRDCARRGMRAPVLAAGDGALGFWAALREVFPATAEQRCWFHRSRQESRCACRDGLGGLGRVEQGLRGGVLLGGWFGGVAVLGEERADFADDVCDGAAADGEQFGEDILGAQLALVEHGGQDAFGVGDFLGEHAAAGAREAFPAAAAVTVSFVAGVLDAADLFGHRGQFGAAHAGQGWIAEQVWHLGACRDGAVG
jgi:hypothetical protein